MNKEDKKRRKIIILLCLVVIIAVVILLITNNSGDSQRKEDKQISSEDASGIIEDDIALASGDVFKKESEAFGMISETNTRDKSEKETSVEHLLDEEVLNEENMTSRTNFDIEAETELVAIAEHEDTSFPVSYYSGQSGSNNGNGETSDNQQESIRETDSHDTGKSENSEDQQESISETNSPGEPVNPVIPSEGDISDESKEKNAFEKAQEEAGRMGESNYYEYYLNEMTSQDKQNLYDSAPSPAVFLNWLNDIREEYEKEQVYSTGDISFDE